MNSSVISVSKSPKHTFNKFVCPEINLLKGLGVERDAHMGKKVKHRSRVAKDPNQPNLRQVHLIQSELFDELKDRGYMVSPGQMGENITTRGIDLLTLPTNTILSIGESASIQIKGLRNPCKQIDSIQEGLMNEVIDRDSNGNLIRKSGVMGIVLEGGIIREGDSISIEFPPKPFKALERV